ncbi:MAG: DNA-protecting protein DprA [Clostridiales bacterium]|nr:DNA-protecting protein DprA [Clostridiales bacterium]
MSSLRYWVWLSSLTDLKPKSRSALISEFGEPESLYFADDRQLSGRCGLSEAERLLLSDKSLDRTNTILELCHRDNIAIITLKDAIYPERLKNISDPPVVLYVKGRLPAVDEQAAIAIVGTRGATAYGLKMARKMGFEVTKAGGLVVTGLAAGVDSAAAEGALRGGGSCLGVLGCGIDQIYPSWNTQLFDDVAIAGALISEYPPKTVGQSRFFPERNRIISGLSLGVTIIEAPARSGALITASRALDQGREVFAVPGNADAPSFVGSNRLIREGAILVTNGWELMQEFEALFPEKLRQPEPEKLEVSHDGEVRSKDCRHIKTPVKTKPQPEENGKGFAMLRVKTGRKAVDNKTHQEYSDLEEQLKSLTQRQLQIVSVMDKGSKHVDDIIDESKLTAPEVLSELTVLQIKGVVTQESGKRFTLNIIKK